ncbi:SRPBCC family protein [Sphingobacterium psychroaquaticum]|uniref:Polyketide cyclase / dehydrase and lipid transport n=1 Tax=Sphingobacterium psychroaquaticum TaxID=561061 RepID=A0A1X7I7K8_9SPHI|nr:SRPBCC family protein [Sphingobacterium psychroaquaticum]SMG10528.1 Polyketide cyclase / dehydrase and lipid transport [Sphingobacterium psychroaquaticum]
MKILKYILFIVLGLIAAVLIVALIVPKTFHAGSTISINKPANEVFDYVVLLRNQGNYDNWSKQDPNIDKKYTGTDGTVGFTYEWKSKKVGDGKQVITQIDPGKKVEMNLFFNGSETANPSSFVVTPIDSVSSTVEWQIDGTMPYPFNIMSLCYDMNKDFDAGLQNLKRILEKN